MQVSAPNHRVSNKNHRRPQNVRQVESPVESLVEVTRECIRSNPEAAALWCLGIGFIIGWKLKPW